MFHYQLLFCSQYNKKEFTFAMCIVYLLIVPSHTHHFHTFQNNLHALLFYCQDMS